MTSHSGSDAHAPIVLRQLIPGTPSQVFDAWLDADSLAVWMCPGAIARVEATVDARVGGTFRIVMHEAGGANFVQEGSYVELTRPSRIVFTWISAVTEFQPSLVTVELQPDGDGTELVLTHQRLPNPMAVEMHAAGWTTILEKLAAAFSPSGH